MAKKNIEKFISEAKEDLLEREMEYYEKIADGGEDKEELKFINSLRARLKFIERLHFQLTGKTGKERDRGEDDVMGRILEMKSSMGNIVTSAEKTG